MKLPLRTTFFPLGFAVEFLTNEPVILQAAQESFGHRNLTRGDSGLQIRIGVSAGSTDSLREPIRREFNHLYSLTADPENHAMLDLKTCTSFIWLNQASAANSLYLRHNFLEKVVYLLLGASVVTDIHAACVSKQGRGILLCGDSGAGKTTLAYACVRTGWTYTSDDTSYLINDSITPRVIGHSHRARFRPTAKDLFPELATFQVSPRMEGKPSLEIPVRELPIGSTAHEADIQAVIYLRRGRGPVCRLTRLPLGSATKRMQSELFSAGEIRAKHEKLLEVFWSVPTYELQYDDLASAIDALDQAIDTMYQ